jgi:hypothetical protein
MTTVIGGGQGSAMSFGKGTPDEHEQADSHKGQGTAPPSVSFEFGADAVRSTRSPSSLCIFLMWTAILILGQF